MLCWWWWFPRDISRWWFSDIVWLLGGLVLLLFASFSSLLMQLMLLWRRLAHEDGHLWLLLLCDGFRWSESTEILPEKYKVKTSKFGRKTTMIHSVTKYNSYMISYDSFSDFYEVRKQVSVVCVNYAISFFQKQKKIVSLLLPLESFIIYRFAPIEEGKTKHQTLSENS
jgi:hypothetical protein